MTAHLLRRKPQAAGKSGVAFAAGSAMRKAEDVVAARMRTGTTRTAEPAATYRISNATVVG
jgi:hypothetical protein